MSDDFDKMVAKSVGANQRPEWHLLTEYLSLRGRGVHKPALAVLEQFVALSSAWAFEDRLEVSRWFLESLIGSIPAPLLWKIVQPTCQEWCAREPNNVLSHLALGRLGLGINYFERALELDPECSEARGAVCLAMIEHVGFNQHHLPDHYIKDPVSDLVDLAKAELVWEGRKVGRTAERCLNEIREYRQNAEGWIRDHPG